MVSSPTGLVVGRGPVSRVVGQNNTDVLTQVLSARCCDHADGLLLLPTYQVMGKAVLAPEESACQRRTVVLCSRKMKP